MSNAYDHHWGKKRATYGMLLSYVWIQKNLPPYQVCISVWPPKIHFLYLPNCLLTGELFDSLSFVRLSMYVGKCLSQVSSWNVLDVNCIRFQPSSLLSCNIIEIVQWQHITWVKIMFSSWLPFVSLLGCVCMPFSGGGGGVLLSWCRWKKVCTLNSSGIDTNASLFKNPSRKLTAESSAIINKSTYQVSK